MAKARASAPFAARHAAFPRKRMRRRNWYDVWLPNLAPSVEVMKMAQRATTPKEWLGFFRRYRAEMARPENSRFARGSLARRQLLRRLLLRRRITLPSFDASCAACRARREDTIIHPCIRRSFSSAFSARTRA